MVTPTPDSWANMREANACHLPAGRADGGQFCSTGRGAAPGTRTFTKGDRPVDLKIAADALGLRSVTERDLHKLAASLIAGVPGNYTIKILSQSYGITHRDGAIPVTVQCPGIRITIEGDEHPPTQIMRALYRHPTRGIVARHIGFEKAASQPPHFGKGVLRAHMETYEALGVSEIETYADIDVGAYAWAKYGFLPKTVSWIPTLIRNRVRGFAARGGVHEGVRFTSTTNRKALDIAASGSPTALWDLADWEEPNGTKPGKAILKGSDGWEGILRLDNEAQMARFWRYVGRKS